MAQRLYRVTFEWFLDNRWQRNSFVRDVMVKGGAEQAIKVATQREKRDNGPARIRAEAVQLIGAED